MASADSLRSMETGLPKRQSLKKRLKDVLHQLEEKEKAIQSAWTEFHISTAAAEYQCNLQTPDCKPPQRPVGKVVGLDELLLLTADDKCEEWTTMVISVCERLVTYMDREVHLQKWAMVLRNEGDRIAALEAKGDQQGFAVENPTPKTLLKSAGMQTCSVEEDCSSLAEERDKLVLWVTQLQERNKVLGFSLRTSTYSSIRHKSRGEGCRTTQTHSSVNR